MNRGNEAVQRPAFATFAVTVSLYRLPERGRFYMTDVRVVLTTAGSTEEARRIANELVERRLAACVNVVTKLDSIFRWRDKVQESEEYLLLIKTTKGLFPKVRDAIKEMHSYELPECISLAVEDGTEEYFKWIDDNVESSSEQAQSPKSKSSG